MYHIYSLHHKSVHQKIAKIAKMHKKRTKKQQLTVMALLLPKT